jgi:GH24 family phage-related lysozyme (muramidase)
MRAAVARGWVRFSETFESNLDFLYLDVLGWVTIGLGLLADPVEMLARMGVEFYWPGPGRVSACTADVRAAHAAVKAATALERGGGVAFGALPGNAIRATPESLAKAADYTLAKNEANVRKYFPGWDTFPAAGQMLILSMAWAMGSHAFGRWPHFVARVNEGDWLAVAVPHDDPSSCLMSEHGENEGFHLRNLASLELAKAAAFAVDHGLEEELDVDALLAAAKMARAAEGTAPARA